MKDLAAIQKPHFQQVTHVYDHAIHAGLVSSQMTSWVAQLLAKKLLLAEACHHACTQNYCQKRQIS